MLKHPAPFPFPGAQARTADGIVWTILQSLPDGVVMLGRDDTGFTRRDPIADLADPSLDGLATDGLDDRGIRQLVWLRDTLATANSVVFASLRGDMSAAAGRGEVPTADGFTLSGLLKRLGWHKVRNVGSTSQSHSIWQRTRATKAAA